LLNPKWATSSKENSDEEDQDKDGFVKDNVIFSINNEDESKWLDAMKSNDEIEEERRGSEGKKPKKKKKVVPTSFIGKLLEFIFFSYEFILGSVVIGSSLIYESIPSCLYIVLAMGYMRYSVYFDKSSIFFKLVIASLNVLISFAACVTKGVLVYVTLYNGSKDKEGSYPSKEMQDTYQSFGITFIF